MKKMKFKPHKMFKGKLIKLVKSNASHLRLGKLGWKHTKPKAKKKNKKY